MRARTTAQLSGMLIVFFIMIRQLVLLNWRPGIVALAFPYLIIGALETFYLLAALRKKPEFMDAGLVSFFVSLAVSAHPAMIATLSGNSHPILPLWGFGVVMNIIQAFLIIWALVNLRNNLTVLPEANRLVVKGPYRFTRHPLYLAYVVLAVDEMAIYQTRLVVLLAVIQIVLILVRARREEVLLLDKMPEYREYYNKVPWLAGARGR